MFYTASVSSPGGGRGLFKEYTQTLWIWGVSDVLALQACVNLHERCTNMR